jgi:hypothetical protein
MEVPRHVVAVAGMAAGDEHTIRPLLEGAENEDGIDPPGAGKLEDPHVGRILQPARPRQVRPCVGAPGADESDYFRFEVVFLFFSVHGNLKSATETQRLREKLSLESISARKDAKII